MFFVFIFQLTMSESVPRAVNHGSFQWPQVASPIVTLLTIGNKWL